MRCALLIIFTVILNAVVFDLARGQSKSSELDRIERGVIASAERDMPDWDNKTTTPIEESYDVSIQQWQLNSQRVTITIVGHPSPQQAKTELSRFINEMKNVHQIPEDGEDSYTFGDLNSATFRRGRFTINIDITTDKAEDKRRLLGLAKRFVADAMKP